jgi:hypothetical protein
VGAVPANPWELRADVQPLELAARRWEEVGTVMARRGDEIVDAARRATEGWDAAAAESYEQHRRQVLGNVDRFTALATRIAGSLRAISSILTASQAELDRAWTRVAMVPHDVVGESRHLVFHPTEDDDRGKVAGGQRETEEIRRRLTLSLDQETARLRGARTELVTVRTELADLAGGTFGSALARGDDASGVGVHPPTSRATSVPGSAQSGGAALAPIAPISVSTPDLTGISAAGLAPLAAAAAAGAVLGGRRARRTTDAAPPAGGMGAGGMAARAGTMSRGMPSGRRGAARPATPKLDGEGDDAATAAREKDAAREAKRAALEEKRAQRAARKAARESEKEKRDDAQGSPEGDAGVEGEGVTVVEVAPGTARDDDAPAADRAADDGGAVR